MKLISKRGWWSFAAGGVTLAGVIFLALIWFRTGEGLPQPNGYDDFVKAGGMVVGKTSNVDSTDPIQVAAFAAKNSAVLAQVRSGLAKSCRVPVEFKTDWMGRHMKEIMAFREACNVLELLAKEREAAGAIDEAVSIRLDRMRLGIEARRGGVLNDYMVGAATEQSSIANLTRMVDRLDLTQCSQVLKALKESAGTIPVLSDVNREERRWKWLGSGWWQSWDGIKKAADELFSGSKDKSLIPTSGRPRELSAAQGKLVLALARREFELEQGRAPASDAELVPKYLLSLPSSR